MRLGILMFNVLIALVAFLVSHVALAESPGRAWSVARLGQRGHLLFYSLLSLALIWWLGSAVAAAPVIELWPRIAILHLLPVIAMPFALMLVVCGISQNNPSSIYAEQLAPPALHRREPRGILTITRNPVMWGIGIWAAAHALAGNQLAEILRFGSFALLAILGSYRIDRKAAARWGVAEWAAFAARTSNLPLLAILQGRIGADWRQIGWLRPLVAVLLYLLLLRWHPAWFGLPAVNL